ncbi:PQQ-binding-like beta-propeller repeat protein [Pantoea sp. EA-12]|uniref:PQQ-binding-like beta-propeller repeat protein n=1 Tax=Pantoea sp. EA-12 TaxID=3043303 RepID=UPI0024B5EE4E|nr:PQQ-binding-like beta-propeller repeat protein [Pantoea sp. EA-12]MDI9221603.1 PQQ-binding-like beta-propeller repeat protein [Pantoea sp. EA-12]
MAYWHAANPVAEEACQKVVYMGTVDGKLYALDADSGKPCENFAWHGVLNVEQWNTIY